MNDVPGQRPAISWVHYTTNCNTQSSAPEDGQNNFPKHVELTGIINKPLLLHVVGCLYYYKKNSPYILAYTVSGLWQECRFLNVKKGGT